MSSPGFSPASKAARLLGRLGGLKGGPARARKLSPERRQQIASDAGRQSWKNRKVKDQPQP